MLRSLILGIIEENERDGFIINVSIKMEVYQKRNSKHNSIHRPCLFY